MGIISMFKRLISGINANKQEEQIQPGKIGCGEYKFSETNKLVVQQCAARTLQVFTESLDIANQSKNLSTRESRLQVARDKLIELKEMEKQYPFLHLENLKAVEASIAEVEAETQEMREALSKPESIVPIEDLKGYYLKKALDLNTAEKNQNYYLQNYPEDFPHRAWCEKIAKLPLAEQCLQLNIAHEKIEGLPYGKKPEIDALNHFADQGFVGAYCEGGPVLLLIRAAALDVLAQISFSGRTDACTRFTEAQLVIYKESSEMILKAIRNTDKAHIVRNFNEIYKHQQIPRYYPGLNSDIMSTLFAAIGAERLAQITEAVMKNPYSYRSGWPDLTMVKDSDMSWVEIKTTDRLHVSQIMTISRMKPLLPGNIQVLQLTKTKPKGRGHGSRQENQPIHEDARPCVISL